MTRVAVRLKWHKLRNQATDPPFQRHNLVAALAAGQPCEVDLRFTADHHAVCLHDRDLHAETTGAGPVAQAQRAEVERLRQRGSAGEALATAPLFLDEVVAAVQAQGSVGPGLVQLDVKTPVSDLRPEALARFGHVLGEAAPAFIASGYEWELISRLRSAAPGLQAGFDPLALYHRPQDLRPRQLRTLARRTLALAPGAAIYYLEARLVLAGLDRGVDLVAAITGGDTNGALVDAWTVDPSFPDLPRVLRRLLAAGVGQITTNDPAALGPLLAGL
jgi:glycerophosphoryl diester phosphodiesterase